MSEIKNDFENVPENRYFDLITAFYKQCEKGNKCISADHPPVSFSATTIFKQYSS